MAVRLPFTEQLHYKHKLLEQFPEGFVVVVDTRETDPLLFRGDKPRKNVPIVRKTLAYGDYSILGFEECISVERKKSGDLYRCLGKERERFKKELEKLQYYERRWLLIEDSEKEVLQPFVFYGEEYYIDVETGEKKRHIHPNSVRQSLVSIGTKLGIPIHYSGNKTNSEIWLLDRLVRYYKWKRGDIR